MLSNEKVFYVYIWYIIGTNEIFYVGKGKGKRYKQITKRNKFFTDMYNTHNCRVEKVFEGLTEKEAFELEIELIHLIRTYTNDRLTNQTDGGEGNTGYKPTKETIQKMSMSSKEKWKNDEFRQKMIKIRNSPDGVYQSKEFREKISKLVQKENNPNYNNHWSKEQKKNLSSKKIRKKLRSDNGNSKRIICLETGEVFDCILDAQKHYDVKNDSSFSIALKEDVRTAAGLHWKYYSEELLNEQYRKEVLINILGKSKNKASLICLETKEIFFTTKELISKLGISMKKFKKEMNNGILKYNNYTYMFIRNYINCPVYQR